MSDHLTRSKSEDSAKINVYQLWELDYWTQELGVTEQALRIAVAAVGPAVADVKRYLLR